MDWVGRSIEELGKNGWEIRNIIIPTTHRKQFLYEFASLRLPTTTYRTAWDYNEQEPVPYLFKRKVLFLPWKFAGFMLVPIANKTTKEKTK